MTRKNRPAPVWRSFSAEEARRQLETVIQWGRYGELFGFEDDTGELFLETSEPRPETRGRSTVIAVVLLRPGGDQMV